MSLYVARCRAPIVDGLPILCFVMPIRDDLCRHRSAMMRVGLSECLIHVMPCLAEGCRRYKTYSAATPPLRYHTRAMPDSARSLS